MQSDDDARSSAARVHGAGEGADSRQIADAALSTWQSIAAALSPIVGQRGVAALYKRSLHLARASRPWLTAAHDDALVVADFRALHAALIQQPPAEAAAGHAALLKTFRDLLTSLIGPSLTERLLRSVWGNLSSDAAAQEPPP